MKKFVKAKTFLKKIWFKTWPKASVAACGVGLFLLSYFFSENIRNLLISISAALISVPIIFVAYELWDEKSHRQLNKGVYRYAENEMSQIMLKMKKHMSILVYGYCVYFDHNDIDIDDSNPGSHVIKMNETSKIISDEDGETYQLKYQMEECAESEHDDICEIDKAGIVPVMADVRYLGYQIVDMQLNDIIEDLNELLKNYFIMSRLDDYESSIIVHLLEAAKMLNNLLTVTKDDLFLPTDLNVVGFKCEASDTKTGINGFNVYSLYYTKEDQQPANVKSTNLDESKSQQYEQLLDEKILDETYSDRLMTVYVVNPDRYIILGDLVTEVLSCINEWRKTNADGVVVDYEYAGIREL